MSDHSKKLELTTNTLFSPLLPVGSCHPCCVAVPSQAFPWFSTAVPLPSPCLGPWYTSSRHESIPLLTLSESNARQGTMDYWCAPRLGPSMPYGSFGIPPCLIRQDTRRINESFPLGLWSIIL
ncbi:hypothetical protein BO83DRAFT_13772 [Aspergillus eucalypticola CBS 122712]|uniref:Uncharacterized protein n=1 Tax=Aspergillus eucalypticola (strain CBS 122712 / IBT 29274) TaxID=1448314 RepID=A0A317VKA8_ASPEC|nr:uncharacterized protein BO83DRAFT_13772 [Aspergillus eucalypticola CBS 122712]PWY74716.1 hypothetical protein BO83DRAFT_13772 [Aspergillus eucalypticola CBS 122712]